MMANPLALPSLKRLALAVFGVLIILGGAAAVLKTTVDYLLYWDATAAAESWARYVAENVTDIEEIANGNEPSASSMTFLIRTQQIRHVFGFEIVDLHGNSQLRSDGAKISRIKGKVHSDTADRAAASGRTIVSVKEGVPPIRPKIYAEAYLPVMEDQRLRAVVVAYVDLSEQHDQFRKAFLLAALALFVLGVAGAGVPTFAWQRMMKEKQRSDRRMHIALDEAHKAAEAAGKAKSNFLASMSHEIRTPLNGVLGMAQSLHGDDLTAEQSEKVAIILDSGTTLMALLNDVLDLSKIEAGKMNIAPIDDDLRESVMRAVKLFQPGASDKGITLATEIDPALPERLNFDPVRVRQCVSNLLANAIKFTDSGGSVDVRLSTTEQEGGIHLIAMTIADTGIGMDGEALGKLFSVFSQADDSTSRRFGGTGLGLAISRQLAQAMGGNIVVESVLGKGSSFHLTFKAQAATSQLAVVQDLHPIPGRAAGLIAGASSAIAGARVLLVDDNAVNRQVVKLFLKPFGLTICEAVNGQDALAALRCAPFDLVLLDVNMPVMDGCETIMAIRSSADAWHDVPAIALTADAMSGDRERYLSIGMTDYLSKPIDQRELISKMTAALALHSEPPADMTAISVTRHVRRSNA
jgi:signal transduction histidine kinase/CheY-like chemotaxis protein